MRQVVTMVEEAMRQSPRAKPVAVKLRISARSHVLEQDPATLQAAFTLAAKGTVADGAALEIIVVPAMAVCTGCGQVISVSQGMSTCSSCGSTAIGLDEGPEVVVQEVLVTE